MSAKQIATILIDCFKRGNKLLIIGNGGSAAEAQHFAAEFICKFQYERKPLPAIALSTDSSVLTSISNDFGYEYVFTRQIRALGKVKDVLISLSTSGKSLNVNMANTCAKELGLIVIDFPRKGTSTAKIQENQLKLIHSVCAIVEKAFI